MNKDKLDTTNSFNKGQNGIIDQIRGFYRSTMKRIYGKSDEEKIPPTKIQQRKDIFVIFISMIVVSLLTWLISPTITILALTLTLIFGIVAISLNHQVGQTGIINFGVVGFFAVGAYATAMLSLMGWPWFFTLIGGMLFSGIVAFIVSIPSLKLREDYFAIAIITLGEIFRVTFQQEDWLVYPLEDLGFYGGTRGLSPQNVIVNDFKNILGEIPPHKVILDSLHDLAVNGLGIPGTIPVDINFLNWFNFSLNMRIGDILLISEAEARNLIFLGILLLCAIATYVIFERIYNSPIGRLNKAIREDDLATESLGFDVYRHKIIAVTLGSMFAGLAGGFLAFHQGSINPADFIPLITFMVWTIMVIGGFANHRGAILGALVVMASQPIVVNQKENITNFFVSLMVPFLPAVVDAITDLINPAIKGIGIFGIIAFPTDDPETALILLNVAIPLSFIAVTTVLALVLIAAYIKPQEWKYRKKILYLSGFLLIFTLIPFILNHLPILPILTFDFFRNVTKVQFVALSTFFINLDPLLARSIALGIIMVLFLLFKPEGALKERIIFTVDPHEQLDEYLDNKKSKENGLSHNPTEKQETVKTGNPNSEKELLHTDGLNKSFGGITALKEVSIAVKKGPLIGIIGPNGSGKSTFFNVVTGLHNQDKNKEGKIVFNEHPITIKPTHERIQLGLGRTFQQARLFPNMTVLENLLVAPPFQIGTSHQEVLFRSKWKEQEKELHQRAFQILDFLDILHIWEHKTSEISGGQQKLVSLGRSLMAESQLILLDEPVAGVNPTLANKIFERISHLQQSGEQSFVIIEHNMDVQLSYCDYVYVFNKGEIVAEGTPDHICADKTVIEAYLGH